MYPAKSYAVAYIYALLIEHYFGDDARQVLADPSLLYNNDKHFVPYNETTSAVYDEMFDNVSVTDILTSTIPQVAKTVEWFKKEMLLL